MKLTSNCFADQHPIPGQNSFCIPDGKGQCVLGGIRNPDLTWSGLPTGTRSLALICLQERRVPLFFKNLGRR